MFYSSLVWKNWVSALGGTPCDLRVLALSQVCVATAAVSPCYGVTPSQREPETTACKNGMLALCHPQRDHQNSVVPSTPCRAALVSLADSDGVAPARCCGCRSPRRCAERRGPASPICVTPLKSAQAPARRAACCMPYIHLQRWFQPCQSPY
jgi:hypothetical protein